MSGKTLARLIAANTPLETLRLGCNELHDNAAYEIASALMDNETLVELDLSFNGLTDGALSVRFVSASLHPRTCAAARGGGISAIDSVSHGVSPPGGFLFRSAQDLAQGVRHARSLASIKLWGNFFGPSSAEAWGQLLRVRCRALPLRSRAWRGQLCLQGWALWGHNTHAD